MNGSQPAWQIGIFPGTPHISVFPFQAHPVRKFFYVWLDAPVGYFGSFKHYFKQKRRSQAEIDEFLRSGGNTEMIHFIGKDILYFHALFWPAMLEFSGYRTPTQIYAHGFLTVNGQKMSKSRGTFITAEKLPGSGPESGMAALLLRRQAQRHHGRYRS